MMSSLPSTQSNIISSSPATLTGDDRYWGAIFIGFIAIALAFIGLSLWSMLAPLSSAAIAPGSLVVEGSRKSLQHLDGGIIKKILIKDGDAVVTGQLLIQLDEIQTMANLKLIQSRYAQARALEARLVAERDSLDILNFPSDLRVLAEENQDAEQAMVGQQQLFEARRTTLRGQLSILDNRISQSKAQISGLALQEKSKAEQARLFVKELEGIRQLFEKGIASGKQVAALERELARLAGERGETSARIAEVNKAIGEANLQIHQLRKSFDENIANELKDTQTQIFEAAEKLNLMRETLARLSIRAPVSGKVVDLAVHTTGGVIVSGSRILDIVPVEERLVVEARLSPNDIDGVHEGLQADLRFTGFRHGSTPVVKGMVTRVSADRLMNPRTEQPYFIVQIVVDVEDAQERLKDYRLVPGVPVEAIINKGERTLAQYFFQPIRDAFVKSMRG